MDTAIRSSYYSLRVATYNQQKCDCFIGCLSPRHDLRAVSAHCEIEQSRQGICHHSRSASQIIRCKSALSLKPQQRILLLPTPQHHDRFAGQMLGGQFGIDRIDTAVVDISTPLFDRAACFAFVLGQA